MQVGYVSNSVYGDFDGMQVSGAMNTVEGNARGLQATGGANMNTGHFLGLQAAGLINSVDGDAGGLQAAGALNAVEESFFGLQAAGAANLVAGDMRGLQASGILNWTRGDLDGLQATGGINLSSHSLRGAQVGVINIGNTVQGAQIGVINIAKHVQGTQVGVVNLSHDLDGVPIGLFSYSKNGAHSIDVWASDLAPLNAGFKLGGGHADTLLTCGIIPAIDVRYTCGVGLGVRGGDEHKSLNFDVLSSSVLPTGTGLPDMLNSARLFLELSPGRLPLSLLVGPTLNAFLSFNGKAPATREYLPEYVIRGESTSVTLSPGFVLGVSL
jgi:hypothetical protein